MYQQQQQLGSGPGSGPGPDSFEAEAAAQNYDNIQWAGTESYYPVSKLADLLNSVPRFDMNLRPVRSAFQPDQTAYKESLLVWCAVPFGWLLFTLLLFLIYFCIRCCCCHRETDAKRTKVRCCLRCTTAVFAGLACCVILVGFYGNEETHKGLEQAVEGSNGVIETIATIQSQIPYLNNSVLNVGDSVEKMKEVYRLHPELHRDLQTQLYTSISAVYDSAVKMFDSLGEISRYMSRVNVNSLDHYHSTAQKIFNYRRLVTLIFFGLLALFCLMLLIGICNSSKCTLILFCAVGIFCLVFCYLSQGLHIGLSLLIGDFCVTPHTLLHGASTDQSESEVINYYISCDNIFVSNPFKKSASDHLKNANSSLTKAVNVTSKFILQSEYGALSKKLYETFDLIHDTLLQLTANVECTALNKNYKRSLDGICHKTLLGVVLVMSALGASGLLFSVLVVLSSLTWYYFGRNCSRGSQVRMRADLMPMQRRTTPPPAYNSSEFYRQYGDVNSSE